LIGKDCRIVFENLFKLVGPGVLNLKATGYRLSGTCQINACSQSSFL